MKNIFKQEILHEENQKQIAVTAAVGGCASFHGTVCVGQRNRSTGNCGRRQYYHSGAVHHDAATSVTVQVTGYENLSKAKLTLNMGPEGTASDWGMSNPPRISLGSKTYTGASSYTFSIDPSKLIAGQNIQAFLYYWSDTKEDWTYAYGNAVEITDGPVVPSAAITTSPVTNRVTQLEVTLKNLPPAGSFASCSWMRGRRMTPPS